MGKKGAVIFFGSVLFLLLLSSCSDALHTKAWVDKKVDFKKYKTYAWVAPGDTTLNSRRDDKLFAGTIEHYANEELKKRGLTMDATEPDVVVMFDTHVEDRIKYSQAPTLSLGVAYRGPGYYVGGSAPVAGGQITESEYKEGMMIIEMFDMRTKQSIWRGTSDTSLDHNSDIGKIIQDAIRYMFAKYPVKSKS